MTAAAIRRALPADAGAIAVLLHDFNREFDAPTPPVPALAARCEELLRAKAMTVLLAGEPPLGVAVLRLRPSPWTEDEEAHLQELYVVPAQRGRGIGRALVEATIEAARQAGATRLDLGTGESDTGARALYEKLGFTNREGGRDDPRMLFYERDI
ncbi:MAG: GNAT family N-acetyltransferase [Actinobacteria bacterium]|nr:GNAT family N-acetyltransferase [Actinomycetota bacterium]